MWRAGTAPSPVKSGTPLPHPFSLWSPALDPLFFFGELAPVSYGALRSKTQPQNEAVLIDSQLAIQHCHNVLYAYCNWQYYLLLVQRHSTYTLYTRPIHR